jgi:hypothetical protein
MTAKNQLPGRGFTRAWFYISVVALVLAVWGLQNYVYHQVFSGPGIIFAQSSSTPTPPSDWQKMTVQAMTDTNRLLITLGTALLGALGLLMGNKVRGGAGSPHMWAAFLAGICGALSLYFGYVSHLNLVAMISNQTFNSYDPVYLFSSHAQFYSLLAGAFFLADFVVHDFKHWART